MNKASYNNEAPQYLREFLNYMSTIKGRSENTIRSYYNDIKIFFRFIRTRNGQVLSDTPFSEMSILNFSEEEVRGITLGDTMAFLHFMSRERENNAKSRTRRAVALRRFFKYLTDVKGWFKISPLEHLELPSPKNPLPKHLTVIQATRLLETHANDDTWKEARNYCILTFFMNCGMRLSELVGININDYKVEKDNETGENIHYLKVKGKGDKERVIYMNNACKSAYEDYLIRRTDIFKAAKTEAQKNKIKNTNALFLSGHFRRISNRRVQQIIEDSIRNIGLDGMGYSVHKLRHTAATLMYQNGVDVRVLKDVLGHENLNTTQIYTHVADKQLKQAVFNNPLANIDKIDK